MEKEKMLSADELFGILDQPDDQGLFILDLEQAREERAIQIMNR